jgi:bacillithiol system protein YtxJ
MGLFSRKPKEEKESKVMPWIELKSVQQLHDIYNAPSDKLKVFFKHSTRCSISSMALRNFQAEWNVNNDCADLYYLDLISFRDVSNEIAQLTGVPHQSPQAIVLKDKHVKYHESHSHIDASDIQKL